jgi:hypothetical protein
MRDPDFWSSLPDSEDRTVDRPARPLARLVDWRDGLLLWLTPTVGAAGVTLVLVLQASSWPYRLGWAMWGIAGIVSILPPSRAHELSLASPTWIVGPLLVCFFLAWFVDLSSSSLGWLIFSIGALLLLGELIGHSRVLRGQVARRD